MRGKKPHYPILLLVVLLIISCSTTLGQTYPVSIAIAVTPPYTSRITDYTNQPNKVMVTLINTSSTTKEVYLEGSFSGENGIRIYTDPTICKNPQGKKPGPVVLNPGVVLVLSRQNIGDVFDANSLVFEGITKNDLLYKTGLPEGDYTLCIRALDYYTCQYLSGEEPQGCSSTFTVTNVETPEILQPQCGEEVLASTPQVLTFSWTRPPGAPLNAQYNLKIFQVLPGTRIPDRAISTANTPVFFDKDMQVNSYVLGPLDPQLVPGNKYVVVVTIFDPAHLVNFRNYGISPSCSFNYVKDLSTEKKKE